MNELDPVSVLYHAIFEIRPMNVSAVDLDDHRRIVLLGAVEQLPDGQRGFIEFFGKAVKDDIQFSGSFDRSRGDLVGRVLPA